MTVDPAVTDGHVQPADHRLYQSIQPRIADGLPIAAHINADTSWLLLLPYPTEELVDSASPRYLKLIIDPWFTGYNEKGYFMRTLVYSEQHAVPSSVKTVSELEDVLREIETLEGKLKVEPTAKESPIDVVVVSNDNGDHCNVRTLSELHPSVPVVTLPLPYKIIKKLRHFDAGNLHSMRLLTSCPSESDCKHFDWRLANYPGLPKWLSLSYALTPGEHPPFQNPIHTPIMFAFPTRSASSTSTPSDKPGTAIIYTPHSAPTSALTPLQSTFPPLKFLAIMSGLHRVWLTAGLLTISEGAYAGVGMLKALKPKYWLATHDEVKEGTAKGYFVPKLLRREQLDPNDVARLVKEKGIEGRVLRSDDDEEQQDGDVRILQLGSGEAYTLRSFA